MRMTCVVLLLFYSSVCLSQEYTYDTNGNLSQDSNKGILSVHYNHLNLADTITFEDGREIIYKYSGSGQKLQQEVIDAGGRMVRKADYVNGFLYDKDTLRQIRNENGRTVPVVAGNNASSWEYQYEQKDQVGNVRAMLTSRQDTDDNQGTFETANVSDEQRRFQRYDDVRRINTTLFDHTNSGASHFAERLNGSMNEKYGLTKSLSVMPGDVINLEVYAKYVDPDVSHWTTALNTLVSQIAAGTAAAGTVIDGAGYSTSGSIAFPFAGLSGSSGSGGAGPKAYLNWLVFDRKYVFKNGGYVKMSDVAKENGTGVPHERLSKQLTIGEAGYIYVYLSNEETSPVDVFFDDFNVQLVKGPVVQQTDYDPFGLAFNETARENSERNNFLYNGKEFQKDFDLNWYDYGARMYDAALGRWHVIDPKAEKYSDWSPYNYVMNNPIKLVDPDGREPSDGKIVHITGELIKNTNKIKDPLLRGGVEAWLATQEGRRNFEASLKQNVDIYVRMLEDVDVIKMGNKNFTGYTIVPGEVAMSGDDVRIKTDKKGNRSIVASGRGAAPFNGIKLKGRTSQAYLIVLTRQRGDLDPDIAKFEIASSIDHEVGSHCNIDVTRELFEFGFKGQDEADMEHQIYGASYTDTFELRPDGSVIIRDMDENTSAFRIAVELALAAKYVLIKRQNP